MFGYETLYYENMVVITFSVLVLVPTILMIHACTQYYWCFINDKKIRSPKYIVKLLDIDLINDNHLKAEKPEILFGIYILTLCIASVLSLVWPFTIIGFVILFTMLFSRLIVRVVKKIRWLAMYAHTHKDKKGVDIPEFPGYDKLDS